MHELCLSVCYLHEWEYTLAAVITCAISHDFKLKTRQSKHVPCINDADLMSILIKIWPVVSEIHVMSMYWMEKCRHANKHRQFLSLGWYSSYCMLSSCYIKILLKNLISYHVQWIRESLCTLHSDISFPKVDTKASTSVFQHGHSDANT